jgi:PhnB protein
MNHSTPVDPIPAGMHTVTPHLVCAGASDAIAFYKKAFGAEELFRLETPDGQIMNAAIRIGDSMLMLVDEMPDWGNLGPKARGGSSVSIHLQIPDADAAYDRAVQAGATGKMPVAEMFWGDRFGMVEDPFGHAWSFGTRVKILTHEEIAAGAAEAKCGEGCQD